MTSKRKTKKPAAARDSGTVLVPEQPGKTHERILADMASQGELSNAHVMATFAKPTMGELQLSECINALRDTSQAINGGDLSGAEVMLAAQAASLNAIFGEMARRAAGNMGHSLGATEAYLRLALKAQTQCRATLETLATVKAGPAIFARQANIAHGPQQVNNGTVAPRAGKAKSATTGLLGAPRWRTDGQRNGGRGKPKRSDAGSRGSNPRGRARPKVSNARG